MQSVNKYNIFLIVVVTMKLAFPAANDGTKRGRVFLFESSLEDLFTPVSQQLL